MIFDLALLWLLPRSQFSVCPTYGTWGCSKDCIGDWRSGRRGGGIWRLYMLYTEAIHLIKAVFKPSQVQWLRYSGFLFLITLNIFIYKVELERDESSACSWTARWPPRLGLGKLKPGARNFNRISHAASRNPRTWSIFLSFLRWISSKLGRNWDLNWSAYGIHVSCVAV